MQYQETINRSKGWNLYSRHGHTLLHLAQNRDIRMTDLANAVGVTDRQVRSLLKPMEASGVLKVERIGRNNRYELNSEFYFAHPVESKIHLGAWIDWHNSFEE